jgi:hypothetical protein
MCNSISSTLNSQENNYDEVKKLIPKTKLMFKSYTQDKLNPTSNSIIIVPYRDTGEQNRAEQLETFLLHYKDRNDPLEQKCYSCKTRLSCYLALHIQLQIAFLY